MTYEIGSPEWRRDVAGLNNDQCCSPLVVPSRGYGYNYGSSFLPGLREGKWEKRGAFWELKDILHFDYEKTFKFQFIEALMSLPLAVRHQIYGFVALSWNPGKEYPSLSHDEWTSWDYHGYYRFALARRPTNNQQLDYLKELEYRNIHAFVLALERFEGRAKNGLRRSGEGYLSIPHGLENLDKNKKTEKDLGVLNDFLSWFWDNIVMYVDSTDTKPGENWPIHRLYNPRYKARKDGFHQWLREDEQQIHERITHFALETRGLDKFRREGRKEEFVETCTFIRTYLPNVASVFLTVQLSISELQYLMESGKGLMFMWVRATVCLPVRKEFTIKLEVTDWEGSPESLAALKEKGTASLTKLLMPKTLRKGLVTPMEKRGSSKKGSAKRSAKKGCRKKES